MNYHKCSWIDLAQDTFQAVCQINDEPIDKIVSISRGGLIVSRIVSDLRSCQISHIVISSYIGTQKQGKPFVCEVPGVSLVDQSILLVDEVSDTGDTFEQAVAFLKHMSPRTIRTLAPYVKSGTRFMPDYYAKQIDEWIIFPYDVRETYETFLTECGTRELALMKMQELGFEDWERAVL